MARPSLKEKILTEGLRVVHQRGFANASVRDIVQAAGVPQGSFTNHFPSKEAFGLEVINRYFEGTQEAFQRTLLNDELPPLQRLSKYIDVSIRSANRDGMSNGCLFGNFTLEMSEHSEKIRHRLQEIFTEMEQAIAYCLRAAVKAGELPKSTDSDEVAAFIVATLQGGYLLGKADHSPAPTQRVKEMIFSMVLHRPDVLAAMPSKPAAPSKAKPKR